MSPTILVSDEGLPQPSRDTASLRLWRLFLILRSEGWDVTCHGMHGAAAPRIERRFREEGIDVLEPGVDALAAGLRAGPAPDVVLASRPQVGLRVLPLARELAPQAAFVYDTLELTHVRAFRQAKVMQNAALMRKALQFKAIELELTRSADVTLTVTEVERALLEEAVPGAELVVVPSIHYAGDRPSPPRAERRPDLFLAAYWPQPANPATARVLTDDVWPELAASDPELRLVFAGVLPPDWLSEAAARSAGRIVVEGHVPDVVPYLESAWCTVIPQPYGSGVKGKVLSALAHGLPVVGTSIAWEGIPVVDGVHGIVADGPAATIDAVRRLRDDAGLWGRLHAEGPKLIETHFSFEVARAAIMDALDRARNGAAARA